MGSDPRKQSNGGLRPRCPLRRLARALRAGPIGHGADPGEQDATRCPVCRGARFDAYSGRAAAICAGCGALERQRALARFAAAAFEAGRGRLGAELVEHVAARFRTVEVVELAEASDSGRLLVCDAPAV